MTWLGTAAVAMSCFIAPTIFFFFSRLSLSRSQQFGLSCYVQQRNPLLNIRFAKQRLWIGATNKKKTWTRSSQNTDA
ncbi:hypothetical protein F5H01DRAFT_353196 [Linnemannia elongata]|nr:hypothetical protein F5H01DRAFT_353196 [Linnemannia elongata]